MTKLINYLFLTLMVLQLNGCASRNINNFTEKNLSKVALGQSTSAVKRVLGKPTSALSGNRELIEMIIESKAFDPMELDDNTKYTAWTYFNRITSANLFSVSTRHLDGVLIFEDGALIKIYFHNEVTQH